MASESQYLPHRKQIIRLTLRLSELRKRLHRGPSFKNEGRGRREPRTVIVTLVEDQMGGEKAG